MTDLCELALKYGVDKCPQINHGYTPKYNAILNCHRSEWRSILEIGIGTVETMGPIMECSGREYMPGASLRMWRDYFPTATIYGCDIRSDVLFEEDRIRTFYADQSSISSLEELVGRFDTQLIDLIIDDGSHAREHMATSIKTLWKYVKDGGVYIIEDIHDSFANEFLNSPEIYNVRKEAFFYEYKGHGKFDRFWAFRKLI